jgi:hypothetical protein
MKQRGGPTDWPPRASARIPLSDADSAVSQGWCEQIAEARDPPERLGWIDQERVAAALDLLPAHRCRDERHRG